VKPRKPLARRQGYMKRTPLKRVSSKERKKLNNKERTLWKQVNCWRCWVCWCPVGKHGASIDCHEMLDGKHGRPFDVRNYLPLCRGRCDGREGCHELAKGSSRTHPHLTLAIQLTVKMLNDPGCYDPAWMQGVLGKQVLPEPELIPAIFIEERKLHG
jgi:hypothetical protein